MGTSFVVDTFSPAVPLELTVDAAGVGGLEGLSPTVAIRDGGTPNYYLDWYDNTFKTVGWTQQYAVLADIGGGRYQRSLNIPSASPAIHAGAMLIVEYAVTLPTGETGLDTDVIIVSRVDHTLLTLRKALTNRMEETPGNPGTLVLYDDDASTPLVAWNLTDALGGPVLAAVGAPARRSSRLQPP